MIRAASAVVLVGIAIVGVVYGFLSRGPWSSRAAFRRESRALLARRGPRATVTEADLAPLPAPVQRYLRAAGAVGRPTVQTMRARFRGTFRTAPSAPWMPLTAEQVSAFDEPVRLFRMEASRAGIPFEAYHRMAGGAAAFRVKLASLVTVADARGPAMDRSETVTFLNDMAVLAPATLLSHRVRWEPVDDRTARATFTLGAQEVAAELQFDDAGHLVGFWSDDRSMASSDGRSFRAARWSTPLHDHRAFGQTTLASRAEAVWMLAEGAFEYARFEIVEVAYDPER